MPILIKNDKLFCYTFQNIFMLLLFFKLHFVDIILKIFHIMATTNLKSLLYHQHS